MGSFDAGYGCKQAADLLGQKRARELWMLCKFYSASEALQMGLVNAVGTGIRNGAVDSSHRHEFTHRHRLLQGGIECGPGRGRGNGTNGWGIDAIVLHEYRVARKTGRLFRKEGAAIS